MEKIEKMTMEENRLAFAEESGKDGAGMDSTSLEDKSLHIQPAQAEELCKRYFSDYKIEDYQCIGETVSKGYSAYNVQGYDSNGTLLFAEIDQKSGELLRFDYYEDCVEEKFDLDRAEDIAEEFLERLGYEDLEVVRVRHNGTTADFSFVYEMEDVVYYPDEILIKVCQSRGVVTGMDATKYLQNHKGRVEMNPKINMEEAYKKLHKDLSVEASRLAVVQTERGEKLAYEFLCNYQEGQYLVYLDAENGEEISIVNTENLR
jgi:spore germination protein